MSLHQAVNEMNGARLVCANLLAAMLVILSGCGSGDGPSAIVQGTVTLDGELAKSGSVVFHSEADHPAAYGTINNDGSFSLRIGRGNTSNIDSSKIHSGQYTATVTLNGPPVANAEYEGAPPTPGPRLSAQKYASKATSGLSYSLKAGMNVVNIAVESPSEEEIEAMLAAKNSAVEADSAEAKSEKSDTTPTEEDGLSKEGDGA